MPAEIRECPEVVTQKLLRFGLLEGYILKALIGLHLVESCLVTSVDTICTKIIQTFQKLNQELTDTGVTTLLKDNLHIKYTERFKHAWYDQDTCVATAMVLESF